MICCIRKINAQKYPYRTIKCRNYANYNPTNLVNDVKNVNWLPIFETGTDVNSAVQYFTEQVKVSFDKHAPIISKRVKGRPCKWLDNSIKKEIDKRDRLLRKARKSNDENIWWTYKKQRNKFNNIYSKKAKASYHHTILNDTRQNPRKFWNAIKSIFPTKGPNLIPSNEIYKRVEYFGDYFANIARKLKSAFPLVNFIWHPSNQQLLKTDKIFKFSALSPAFVRRELQSLKRDKATGIDDFPPNLLKDCAAVLTGQLTHIINLSIKTNVGPVPWKSAKVTPVFKSGSPDNVDNFRPISVLPILSKILEKAVHSQFYNFLEENKLDDCQFGFRRKRSTKLAVTLFCDRIRKKMDEGNLVGCIYLDL